MCYNGTARNIKERCKRGVPWKREVQKRKNLRCPDEKRQCVPYAVSVRRFPYPVEVLICLQVKSAELPSSESLVVLMIAHMEALEVSVSTCNLVIADKEETHTMLLLRGLNIRKAFCAG